MDSAVPLLLSLGMLALWLLFLALNALAVFVVGWALYHMLHDHWTVNQLWQDARRRLLH